MALKARALLADHSANTAPAKTMTVDAAGDTTLPVIISGDTLIFNNSTTEIFGKGRVVVRHAENVIFADFIYINPDNGDVSGEGNVLAVFNNSRVYTDKIYYNTKTQDAYCRNADVISPPWIIRCESMVREKDKTQLKNPVFTTCNDVKPHYRMEAGEINLYGTKKIEAWSVAVYIGMIPVFYFPYFSQSLEQNKDPFQIKPGWTDATGWSLSMDYTYFFRFFEQMTLDGSVGFSYYEKLGPQGNLSMQYAFSPNSLGSLTGSFLQEKSTGDRRWGLNFTHSQVFNQYMRAGLLANSTSDSNLAANSIDTQNQYDLFKHEFGGSFTGTFFGVHTLGVTVDDTEQLEPFVNTSTARNYYTYSRVLPSVTYSMPSTQLFPFFYYNHSLNFSRAYNSLTPSAAAEVVYTDTGSFAPALKVNTPKLVFATLSANAGVNTSWKKVSETAAAGGWGEFINSLNTSEALQLDIIPGGHLLGAITHTYAKLLEGGPLHHGMTANSLATSLSGGIGTFSGTASLNYDMLTDTDQLFGDSNTPDRQRDRFSLLSLNGTFQQDVYYMTLNSTFSLYSGQMKTTNLNLSVKDNSPKSMWSASANASYVNNRLDGAGHAITLTVTPVDDTLTLTTAFSFSFTPDFKVSVLRNYDLTQKTLVSHSYALTWYIHCWEADLSWTKRSDNAEEIFFSIAISAIPEFRLNKPSTAMPDQFKNLDTLIPAP